MLRFLHNLVIFTKTFNMKKKVKSFGALIKEKRVSTVAGAWVFYFLVSLLPLLFLFVTAFGVLGVDVSKEMVFSLPKSIQGTASSLMRTASDTSKGVTIFFIIAVIFSASTLLTQMNKDGEYIYGVKSKNRKGIFRRLWAITSLATLFTLFLSFALIFVFKKAVFSYFGISASPLVVISAIFFTILLCYAIIILLEKFISPVKLTFGISLAGAGVTFIITAVGTTLFTLYLNTFRFTGAFYGSLAGVIVFIIWAYILMLALVLGSMVNVSLYKKSQKV